MITARSRAGPLSVGSSPHGSRLATVSRSVRARWWQAAGLCALAVLLGVQLVLSGYAVLVGPPVAALLYLAYLCSPLRPRRGGATHWEAQQRHVREGAIVVYWRPGCRYCLWMRIRLALARPGRRVCWVDIWHDAAAAAYVRDLNDGAEIVPTVILPDGSAAANPELRVLIEELRAPSAARVS